MAYAKVLVVDDEPQILDSLEDLLEDDFEVVTANRGEEALELLKEEDVSVIISDQRMPGLSGYEFLNEAQKHTQATRILLTGYSDMEALVQAVNEGKIYGYVAKPWEPEQLQAMVVKGIQHFRLVQELKRERNLLHALMDNIPDHIYFKDAECRFMRINQAHAALLGLDDPEEAVGKSDGDFHADRPAADLLEAERSLIETGESLVDRITQVEGPDGRVRWLSSTKVALKGASGKVGGIVGISRDITERKMQENRVRIMRSLREKVAALRDIEEVGELLTFFRHSFLEMEMGCQDYRIGVSAAFADLLDEQLATVLDLEEGNIGVFTPEERDLEQVWKEGRPVLLSQTDGSGGEEGRRSVAHFPFSHGVLSFFSSGGLERCPVYHSPTRAGTAEQVAQTLGEAFRRLEDLQALSRTEGQLRQAQKMEAIGQLAGGVSHDFNNLLTVINGYGQLLLERCDDDDEQYPYIEEILQAGGQAESLTRQLLAFSRKQVMLPEVLSPSEVIDRMGKMLGRLIRENIRLHFDVEPGVGCVKADRGQVEQVVVNLVVNARDALPDGGEIKVETADVLVERTRAAGDGLVPPGPYVKLAVHDDGVGMDAKTRMRIFEPFFTTKEEGKGTGLGLATVYGIVKQSGGFIEVESRVGAGTSVEVYLPRVEEEAADPAGKNQAAGGSERVMVVEDAAPVRKVACKILAAQGYETVAAGRADEALEICSGEGVEFDLFLLDVVMPGMNGYELGQRLQAMYPEASVIYMSGYADWGGLIQEEDQTAFRFLQKPFTAEDLLGEIRETLDGR